MAKIKTLDFAGYTLSNADGNLAVKRQYVNTDKAGDTGADPIGDGMFRMYPSGDIVDYGERTRRLTQGK